MGGFGSGWHREERATCVENCQRIDVRQLIRQHRPHGGATLAWTDATGTPRRQVLVFEPIFRLHRWGKRWVTRCPACNTRRETLFLPLNATEFRCRVCYRLTYHSRQTWCKPPRSLVSIFAEMGGTEQDAQRFLRDLGKSPRRRRRGTKP